VRFYQTFIPENRDARDGMQPLGMKEADKLGKVADGKVFLLAGEWVLERDVNQSVEILHIENNGIPSGCSPPANQLQALITAGRVASKVDTAGFEASGDKKRLLDRRRDENAWNDDLIAGPEVLADLAGVRLLDGGLELSSGHIGRLRQIMKGQRRQTFTPRDSVKLGLRRSVKRTCRGLALDRRRRRIVFDGLFFRLLRYILGRGRSRRHRRARLLLRRLRHFLFGR